MPIHSPIDIAKRLMAMAQTGLLYAQDPYDRERYEELQELSQQLIQQMTHAPLPEIADFFAGESSYPTAKVDVRAVVFRGDQVLLVQEKSDGRWALPGGWADIGASPRETAISEVQDEAGLVVEPIRLLALLDKAKHPHPPQATYVYKCFLHCEERAGSLTPGYETLGADFFPRNDLPPLSLPRVLPEQIEMCFQLRDQPKAAARFD